MRHFNLFHGSGLLRAGALALACGLALSACKGGNGDAQAKTPGKNEVESVPVEVAKATRRSVAASYSGTAPLEARAESQVVAKTSGVALRVMVEEGQHVRAGQVLVRLDSARASLQAAQSAAQMHKLQNEYSRAQQLMAQKLISAADHDRIRFDLENARAVNRMANLELSYANVVAPISGVIASKSIKPGNFVQINTPIFRIVDTARLEMVLNVPEREMATLKAGLPVELKVDALPGRSFQGTVDRVAPVVDSGSGTFRVICAFDGEGVLQPGMFGRIGIAYDNRTDALVIPRSALLEGEADTAVFMVKAGKAQRVPVELGYIDGEWVEVRKGVEVGDQVVVAGKNTLRDGTVVTVIGQPGTKPVAAAKPASSKH